VGSGHIRHISLPYVTLNIFKTGKDLYIKLCHDRIESILYELKVFTHEEFFGFAKVVDNPVDLSILKRASCAPAMYLFPTVL